MANAKHLKLSSRIIGTLVASSILLSAVGCGRGIGDVQGRVTLDGKPLTNTVIYFQPGSGPLTQAMLNANGEYRLATPGIGSGVAPGSYRVYLASAETEVEELAKSKLRESDLVAGKAPPSISAVPLIPPKIRKYYSAVETDWQRDVTAGSNRFDFEMTTK